MSSPTEPYDISDTDFVTPDPAKSVPSDGPLTSIRERFNGRAGASKTEPRGRERLRKPRQRKSVPSATPGQFVEPLADLYRLAGAVLLPIDPRCASVLFEVDENEKSPTYKLDRAEICARTLDRAAQQNEALRRLLFMVTTGGTWGPVIAAHMPIVLAALSHHTPLMERIGPMGSMFGVSPNGSEPSESD